MRCQECQEFLLSTKLRHVTQWMSSATKPVLCRSLWHRQCFRSVRLSQRFRRRSTSCHTFRLDEFCRGAATNFVDVATQLDANSSKSVSTSTSPYLYHLSSRLDSGNLAHESHRSLLLQLQSAASQALEWLNRNESKRNQRITFAWKAIADACYDFMAERNSDGEPTGLRLQASHGNCRTTGRQSSANGACMDAIQYDHRPNRKAISTSGI